MAYDDYIQELRKGPKTVTELNANLNFSTHTIWSAMSELEQMKVVKKERTGRNIIYYLELPYQRDYPRIKIGTKENRFIAGIDYLLQGFQKATEGIRALRAIPAISSELLVIGWKAQRAYDTMDERELKKLSRRLKQLRLETERHYYQIINNYQILQQLKNTEDFWTTEGLAKHYNHQTNELGMTLPPVDPEPALAIYQQLQE